MTHTLYVNSACKLCALEGDSWCERNAVDSSKIDVCLYRLSFFSGKNWYGHGHTSRTCGAGPVYSLLVIFTGRTIITIHTKHRSSVSGDMVLTSRRPKPLGFPSASPTFSGSKSVTSRTLWDSGSQQSTWLDSHIKVCGCCPSTTCPFLCCRYRRSIFLSAVQPHNNITFLSTLLLRPALGWSFPHLPHCYLQSYQRAPIQSKY